MNDLKNNNFELDLLNQVKRKHKIKIEKACFSKGWIPQYIILDKTRNIHSYCVFIYNDFFNNSTKFIDAIIEYYKVHYSQLDRPIFIFSISKDKDLLFLDIREIRNLMIKNKLNFFNVKNLFIKFDYVAPKIKAEL